MKKILFKFVYTPIYCCLLIGAIYLAFNYTLSNATKYCPFTHKFDAEMSCEVVFNKCDVKIIRHCNFNSHSLMLSIKTKDGTHWMLNPLDSTFFWDESIISKEIYFDTLNNNVFFIDSIETPLIYLE